MVKKELATVDLELLLNRYSSNALQEMAVAWDLPRSNKTVKRSKNQTVVLLLKLLRDPAVVESKIAKLSDTQLFALHQLNHCPSTFRELWSRVTHRGYPDATEAIYRLILLGFLLPTLARGRDTRKIEISRELAWSQFHFTPLKTREVPRPSAEIQQIPLSPLKEKDLEEIQLGDASLMSSALGRLRRLTTSRKLQVTQGGELRKNQQAIFDREVGTRIPGPVIMGLAFASKLLQLRESRLHAVAAASWPAADLALLRHVLDTYLHTDNFSDMWDANAPWEVRTSDHLFVEGRPSMRTAVYSALERLPEGWIELDALVEHLLKLDPGLGVSEHTNSWADSSWYSYRSRYNAILGADGRPKLPYYRMQ